MRIRAALPWFLPVDDVRQRVGALIPELDIVPEPTAPGRFPLDELETPILTTFHALRAEDIAQLTALKFVQVASTGYDRVDLAACRARGIMVSNIPVANSKTVAEHVILVVLALLRDLVTLDQSLRHETWPTLTGANELAGKVFGVVGMGRIGREVAARLVPFETSTIYYDVVRLSADQERNLGVTAVGLEELVDQSDIISLHLPLNRRTRGMFTEEMFGRMKPRAIFVNAARSELVDPVALRWVVGEGKIRAALDVFPTEPPDFTDPVFRAKGTVFTPHIAGVTEEAQQRFLTETVKNVLRFVQGKEPLYRVDVAPPGADA